MAKGNIGLIFSLLYQSPWSNSGWGNSSPWSNVSTPSKPSWSNAWNDTGGTWRDSPTWRDTVVWTNAPWSNQAPDVTSPVWKNTGTTTPISTWANASPNVQPTPSWMDTSKPVVTPPVVAPPVVAPIPTPIQVPTGVTNPFLAPFMPNVGIQVPAIQQPAFQPGKMIAPPLGTVYSPWADSAPKISAPTYRAPVEMGIGSGVGKVATNIYDRVTNLFGGAPTAKPAPMDISKYPSMEQVTGMKPPSLFEGRAQQFYSVDYGKTRTRYLYDPNKPYIETIFGTKQTIEPGMSYRKDIFGSISQGVPIEKAMPAIKVAPETARTMQTIFDVGQFLNPIAVGGVASPLAGISKFRFGAEAPSILSPFSSTLTRSGGIFKPTPKLDVTYMTGTETTRMGSLSKGTTTEIVKPTLVTERVPQTAVRQEFVPDIMNLQGVIRQKGAPARGSFDVLFESVTSKEVAVRGTPSMVSTDIVQGFGKQTIKLRDIGGTFEKPTYTFSSDISTVGKVERFKVGAEPPALSRVSNIGKEAQMLADDIFFAGKQRTKIKPSDYGIEVTRTTPEPPKEFNLEGMNKAWREMGTEKPKAPTSSGRPSGKSSSQEAVMGTLKTETVPKTQTPTYKGYPITEVKQVKPSLGSGVFGNLKTVPSVFGGISRTRRRGNVVEEQYVYGFPPSKGSKGVSDIGTGMGTIVDQGTRVQSPFQGIIGGGGNVRSDIGTSGRIINPPWNDIITPPKTGIITPPKVGIINPPVVGIITPPRVGTWMDSPQRTGTWMDAPQRTITWMDAPPKMWNDAPIIPPYKPFDTYKPPTPPKFIPPLMGGPGGGGGGGGGGRGFFGKEKVHPIEYDILGKEVQDAPRRKAPQIMHNVVIPFSGGQAQAGRAKQPKSQRNMSPSIGQQVMNEALGIGSKRGRKKSW